MKKYELIQDQEKAKELDIRTCYRIRSLTSFTVPSIGYYVNAGDLGGWIEKEENLDQNTGCWIRENSMAIDNSRVEDGAMVDSNCIIKDNAVIKGESIVCSSVISRNSIIFGGVINQCEIQNSFIECNLFNEKLTNVMRCGIKRLKQLPPKFLSTINLEQEVILNLISRMKEDDRNELFRKLTDLI